MSKRYLTYFSFMVFSHFMYSQNMSTEKIAQAQLDAYNKRDLKAFIDLFAEDVCVYNFTDGSKTIEGKAACEVFYKNMFALSPQLHSTLINRIVFDNKAFDHESITGRFGNAEAYELVMIYEIKEEKIFKVTAVKR
jgi:hypothetical protein